jgi:hypothetical protein
MQRENCDLQATMSLNKREKKMKKGVKLAMLSTKERIYKAGE